MNLFAIRALARKELSFTILFFLTVSAFGKGVSPYQYGFSKAKTGEEKFWVLYNTHVDAIQQETTVDYSGINSIDLEIPSNAKSIPLSNKTDFRGVTLNVKNTKKDNFVLFTLTNKTTEIEVEKKCFSSFDFRAYPELRSGYVILIVEDATPWVENRKGFNYGAIRKDVLLLQNGMAINRPISPYNNETSSPKCNYVVATKEKKVFRNIVFNRVEESTAKTLLLTVRNTNNVEIRNITIHTPKNRELYADQIILFEGCTNVKMSDINVDNTYSQSDKFGYAFGLNPVWNVTIQNVKATADWGVFACSNINKATLKNCTINRFDLHCYGKDYYLENCTITGGMPISSMFGKMEFYKCVFDKAFPCEYRYDYNSYSPFDISFKDCVFKMNKDRYFIVYLSRLSEASNTRDELSIKCLPNVSIKNCTIKTAPDNISWEVIHIGQNYYPTPLGYITNINIDGLKVIGDSNAFSIVSSNIETQNPVTVNVKNVRTPNSECVVNINNNKRDKVLVKTKKVDFSIR